MCDHFSSTATCLTDTRRTRNFVRRRIIKYTNTIRPMIHCHHCIILYLHYTKTGRYSRFDFSDPEVDVYIQQLRPRRLARGCRCCLILGYIYKWWWHQFTVFFLSNSLLFFTKLFFVRLYVETESSLVRYPREEKRTFSKYEMHVYDEIMCACVWWCVDILHFLLFQTKKKF